MDYNVKGYGDDFVVEYATFSSWKIFWIKHANVSHNSHEDSRVTIALGIELTAVTN